MNKVIFIQIFKYGVVGIVNTLLTAVTIWIMLRGVFGIKDDQAASAGVMFVSNFIGYVVGIINSFIFNRNWTFKSKSNWKLGFFKFLLAFGVCYLFQLSIVLFFNAYISIPAVKFSIFNVDHIITSAYIYQLIGIVSYSILNFLINKYYAFNK